MIITTKRKHSTFYKKEMNSSERILISFTGFIYMKRFLLDRFFPNSLSNCVVRAMHEYMTLVDEKENNPKE